MTMGVDAEMFVRHGKILPQADVLQLAGDLCEAIGAERFWIFKDHQPTPRHAMFPIDVYEQDGDDILPSPGEQFLRVCPATRYYGPGYERGNWPLIAAIREWLVRRLPGSEVWYGGDSSGICAEPLTDDAMNRFWAHFAAYGHTPYRRHFPRGHIIRCELCQRLMDQTGFGADGRYAAFWCPGCDARTVTHDAGLTWQAETPATETEGTR